MKKARYLAMLLLIALLLASCGQKTEGQKPETSGAGENVSAVPAQQEQAETPAEVENNGGYYVRANDKVYFRRYGEDALPKAAVFAGFTQTWNVSGASEIMSYDPASGEVEALFAEDGCGPLWYADGGFYLNERYGGEDYVVWYALDGGSRELLCRGVPLGVTESGLLAVERTEYEPDYRETYAFYRDKQPVGELGFDEYYLTYAGLTDAGAFVVKTTQTDDDDPPETTCSLLQVTPEGELIDLGVLPKVEEPGFYDVQADRFLASGDKIAVGVGFYAGTGNFLNDMVFAEATVGQAGSAREMELTVEAEEYDLPYLTTGEDGAIAMASMLEGGLRIDYEDGSLDVYKDGAWRTLADNVCQNQIDGFGYRRIEQHMDYVGDTAYVTLACVHASPMDSVGWRDAFALLDMLYIATDGSGEPRELSRVDHGAELYGDVWFIEGASTALWRQRRSDAAEEEYYVPEYAYAIPIAEDAEWEGGWEAVFDGATGLIDGGDLNEADYYGYNGYPVSDVEPAGRLCLTLDRDGTITHLARKAPEDVLVIDFDVPESELSGAVKTLDHEWSASEEDTLFFWAKLRALEDGVRVRVERVSNVANTNDVEKIAIIEGTFIPGETVYDGVLNRGEFIALRASLPWHPELRVSVSRDGCYGEYVFGEDNWKHLWTEESVHPELLLAARPALEVTEDSLAEAIAGTWFYRSPKTGEVAATLRLDEDGTVLVGTDEDGWQMAWKQDRLYAETYQTPDLLCLSTEQTIGAGFAGAADGSAGDYLFALYRTDGEEILHLTQANNGDGALSYLLSGTTPETWEYDFVFTRAQGAGSTETGRRGATFPAVVVRYDSANGIVWLQDAEIVDHYEDGNPILRPNIYRRCVACPVSGTVAAQLPVRAGGDCICGVFDVTVNEDGKVIAFNAFN